VHVCIRKAVSVHEVRCSGAIVIIRNAVILSCGIPHVSGHAWITLPTSSRLDLSNKHWQPGMPDDDLRYCPSCCNHGNACGAESSFYTENVQTWDQWYNQAGVPLTHFVPGTDVAFQFTVTADHGGQSWLMVSCADRISEDGPWTILERAEDDRAHHFMPSNPGIYAWAKDEAAETMGDVIQVRWTVPQDFSCPTRRGVGRWVWKTSNSCNDVNNIGKHTETFSIDEFAKVFHEYSPGAWILRTCTSPPETFVSCFDFTIGADANSTSEPTLMSSQVVSSEHQELSLLPTDADLARSEQRLV